jgi:hypothetical protein
MMTKMVESHGLLGNLGGSPNEIQNALTHTLDPSLQVGGEPRQHAKRALSPSRKERH